MMSHTATTALTRPRSASTRRCTASTARSKLHSSTPSRVQSNTKHKHVRSKRPFNISAPRPLSLRDRDTEDVLRSLSVRHPLAHEREQRAPRFPIRAHYSITLVALAETLVLFGKHLPSFSNGNFPPFGSTPSSFSSRSQPIQADDSIFFEA